MLILGVVIQNKKGETLISYNSSLASNSQVRRMTKVSFQILVHMFQHQKKVGRSFVLTDDVICITNISREVLIKILLFKYLYLYLFDYFYFYLFNFI